MASRPLENNPWPAQTPAAQGPLPPASSSSSRSRRSPKRRRIHSIELDARADVNRARQIIADQTDIQKALVDCQINSGNDVISCFPTNDTIIPQHEWATFVWNSRRPELTQTNLVNIYLFRADSRSLVLSFFNESNPTNQAGIKTAQVNDSWWGADGQNWNGQNVTFPFYWVITRNDQSLDDGDAIAQSTFSAVQTTVADSISASRASASAAAASSSAVLASLSSIQAGTSTLSHPSASSSAAPGSVQSTSGNDAFPHWAIAVIVVLGFLAICATGILVFLIIRRMRRARELDSNRNSMGSNSPMMANAAQQQSPLLGGGAALGAGGVGAGAAGPSEPHAPSVVMHDGASTISRAGSAGDSGPFSGADAAIMADAFRKMLRKPDFAGRPVEEGESPENPEQKAEMISRELAEEGKDIRSVSSSRNVKLETMSESDGGTVRDHGRE